VAFRGSSHDVDDLFLCADIREQGKCFLEHLEGLVEAFGPRRDAPQIAQATGEEVPILRGAPDAQ
jgi:hypothetical protein